MSDQIHITIAKTLDGEATEAEEKVLQQWLAADESHRAEYEALKQVWQQTDALLQEQPVFHTGAAWENVAQKTVRMVGGEPAGNTRLLPGWTKYALAAAAALLIAFFVYRPGAGPEMLTAYAADGNMEVELPDHSRVSLRKGSRLQYPESFTVAQRTVVLEGEAFFEVAHQQGQPFVVDAAPAKVTVLGTAFNLKATDDKATVIVRSGKVEMTAGTGKSLILSAGKQGLLENGLLTEVDITSENYIFWKTGILKFKDRPFSDIVAELAELHNVDIRMNIPDTQKQQLVTISFINEPVEEMLTELCMITGCRWTKQGEIYSISPKQ